MSNLTDLVPPLELCKKIPEGEFKESVFAWSYSCDKRNEAHFLDYREDIEFCRRDLVNAPDIYPAPTTDEILDACKDIPGVLFPTIWYQAGTPIADCAYDRSGKLSDEFLTDDDFNKLDIIEVKGDTPVTAALKLWIKLKGIEA